MAGKPAARLGDPTAHGGTIVGPGAPTVLIGKMPAATMGDNHICPMMTPGTPPIPHVGGPITLGSTGVLIGKKPAARMGDMAVCVGPPSSIIMGCATVLIGEVGSAGGGGSAGAAAAAQAAAPKGAKKIDAIQPPEPAENKAGENNEVTISFVDSAGKPLPGVRFSLKDPDGQTIAACANAEGCYNRSGYAKQGSFEVHIASLSPPVCSEDKIEPDKQVKIECDAIGAPDGIAHIIIDALDSEGVAHNLDMIESKVLGEKISVPFVLDSSRLAALEQKLPTAVENLSFTAVVGHNVARSKPVTGAWATQLGSSAIASVPASIFLKDTGFLDIRQLFHLEDCLRHGTGNPYFGVQILVSGSNAEAKSKQLTAFLMGDSTYWRDQARAKSLGTLELQTVLAFLNHSDGEPYYSLKLDGQTGPGTTQAIKTFQQHHGLQADGLAGPQTWMALADALHAHLAWGRLQKVQWLATKGQLDDKMSAPVEVYFWHTRSMIGKLRFEEDPSKSYAEMQKCVVRKVGAIDPGKFIISC